jgi:hypothetical protein
MLRNEIYDFITENTNNTLGSDPKPIQNSLQFRLGKNAFWLFVALTQVSKILRREFHSKLVCTKQLSFHSITDRAVLIFIEFV